MSQLFMQLARNVVTRPELKEAIEKFNKYMAHFAVRGKEAKAVSEMAHQKASEIAKHSPGHPPPPPRTAPLKLDLENLRTWAAVEARADSKQQDCRHSQDFTSVVWFGTGYEFSKTQAAAVGMLWEAWGNGTPGLNQETIGEQVSNGDSFRLKNLFRVADPNAKKRKKRSMIQHPAWGTMIVPCGKGIYRLNEPK